MINEKEVSLNGVEKMDYSKDNIEIINLKSQVEELKNQVSHLKEVINSLQRDQKDFQKDFLILEKARSKEMKFLKEKLVNLQKKSFDFLSDDDSDSEFSNKKDAKIFHF